MTPETESRAPEGGGSREGLDTRFGEANDSPGLALWRVTNTWQRQVRAALAPLDLTHVQYVLLASLVWMQAEEPPTQRTLARHAGTDEMMTSQVLRTLAAKGLVERRPHPTDGRAIALSPTGHGIALANRATAAVESADADYFGALDANEQVVLLDMLHRLGRR